jgi:molybdopterin converting factor subunit 1
MRISVRLFASLRDAAGADRVELELTPPATVEDVWRALVVRHPTLAARRGSLAPAVNRSYAGWDQAVADGDETAFIPPVSGG